LEKTSIRAKHNPREPQSARIGDFAGVSSAFLPLSSSLPLLRFFSDEEASIEQRQEEATEGRMPSGRKGETPSPRRLATIPIASAAGGR
jgi:hypothetical protein